jgi:dihydroanticapsin dehydrogenase|tara:strand:+ start:55 stop:798 length:744 start_codon:yes stop_codon:yes gene_type:complete
MNFKNKIVLVTGGSSGIGKATVDLFVKNQATVINIDKYNPKNSSTDVKFYNVDVSNEQNVIDCVSDIVRYYKKIDILVNSAGVTARNALENNPTDYEIWKKVLEVNLSGTYLVSREVVKNMIDNKNGSIVNLSSIMGQVVYPNLLNSLTSPYPPSKGGVLQYTKNLASHVAKNGVRVNCVSPAFITTELTKNILEDEFIGTKLKDRTPMNRFGKPEEVANVILFLSSDLSSYITGADIPVDGGYLIL